MGKIVLTIFGIMVCIGVIIIAIGYTNEQAGEARYKQSQGEALVIRAEAESRLTAATATALLSASLLPWGVLLILGLLGVGVLCLTYIIISRRQQTIERQIIFLPPPNMPRMEVWEYLKCLPDTSKDLVAIENRREVFDTQK